MCICFIATTHPAFKLIVLSNRDEVFDRPTSPATWHSANTNSEPKSEQKYEQTAESNAILCPMDLGKAEHGTWIAMSKTGRLAVLLNVQEPEPEPGNQWLVSRGIFARHFVESHNEAFDQWLSHESQFKQRSGGFNLLCAELDSKLDSSSYKLKLVSNRGPNQKLSLPSGSYCISNAVLSDSLDLSKEWPKTQLGQRLFDDYLQTYSDEQDLKQHGFDILNKNYLSASDCKDLSLECLRRTVFVPAIDNQGHKYGTRTQTVVLVSQDNSVLYVEKDVSSNRISEFRFDLI